MVGQRRISQIHIIIIFFFVVFSIPYKKWLVNVESHKFILLLLLLLLFYYYYYFILFLFLFFDSFTGLGP